MIGALFVHQRVHLVLVARDLFSTPRVREKHHHPLLNQHFCLRLVLDLYPTSSSHRQLSGIDVVMCGACGLVYFTEQVPGLDERVGFFWPLRV